LWSSASTSSCVSGASAGSAPDGRRLWLSRSRCRAARWPSASGTPSSALLPKSATRAPVTASAAAGTCVSAGRSPRSAMTRVLAQIALRACRSDGAEKVRGQRGARAAALAARSAHTGAVRQGTHCQSDSRYWCTRCSAVTRPQGWQGRRCLPRRPAGVSARARSWRACWQPRPSLSAAPGPPPGPGLFKH